MSEAEAPPQEDTPVIAGVRKWLAEQGYPLEMRVARVFHEAGAYVQQSDFYVGSEGKPREIDVTARWASSWKVGQHTATPPGLDDENAQDWILFDIFVVIECKSGPKSQKPWVVFTSPRSHISAFVGFQRLGSDSARVLLEKWVMERELPSLPFFAIQVPVGYSMAVGHGSDNNDQAYTALMSLTAAARAHQAPQNPLYLENCRLVFPVLVVDTPIIECWLDDANELRLRECDHVIIQWRNTVGADDHTLIDIIHERALPQFAASLRAACDSVGRHQPKIEQFIMEARTDQDERSD